MMGKPIQQRGGHLGVTEDAGRNDLPPGTGGSVIVARAKAAQP